MTDSPSSTDYLTPLSALTADIDTIVLAGADSHGIMRGKRVPRSQLERLLAHGMPMCNVFWVMHVDESDLVLRPKDYEGYFPTEQDGYPDILAAPDTNTLRVVPWHPRTALMLCDWQRIDRTPLPIDPRGVLASVVDRGRNLGFETYCALELEFYVLRETTASLQGRIPRDLVPLSDRPSTYGVVKGSEQEPIGRMIRDRMLDYGLPIESCNPETGPGQFEITLEYRPALQAADDAFLFKNAVKEVVAQEGLMATFMAKPRNDWAGNSCHIHLSMRDVDNGASFYDASDPNGFSSTMRHFVGGSLKTMAEMSPFFGPTVNSYRRYAPYSWAATTATWGVDNRSAGIRAIREGESGTRIEHRRGGGDVNPYVAAAAVLAGGLYGIESEIEPRELFPGDVYAADRGSVEQLPRSLEDATRRLAESDVAREWMGAEFVNHFVTMKEAEIEAYSRAVTDWDIARYLEAL